MHWNELIKCCRYKWPSQTRWHQEFMTVMSCNSKAQRSDRGCWLFYMRHRLERDSNDPHLTSVVHQTLSRSLRRCCEIFFIKDYLRQISLMYETQIESCCVTGLSLPLRISAAVGGSWRWLCNATQHTHTHRLEFTHTKSLMNHCTHRLKIAHKHRHRKTSVNVCGLASELEMTVQYLLNNWVLRS